MAITPALRIGIGKRAGFTAGMLGMLCVLGELCFLFPDLLVTPDLAGGLARQDRALAPDIVWGARALAALDRRWSEHLLDRWGRGVSSLRGPAPPGSGSGT